MIKAAFFDIDGTLLSFRTHRVSQGTIRAFAKLHAAGIRTFLSTGRPLVLIPPMPLQFDGHVTMNGGLVFTPSQLLLSNPIPQTDSEAWLHHAASHQICTMLFTADGMMASQINDTARTIRDQLQFPMPPVVDIQQMHHTVAHQIIALIPPEADAEIAQLMPHCHLPRWSNLFTDIVHRNNSKAVGLQAICQHFGIRQEETIAFGDGGNDIPMLQWAGIGIAMGNAADNVKAAADFVTSDVDHEGIEQAINSLLI